MGNEHNEVMTSPNPPCIFQCWQMHEQPLHGRHSRRCLEGSCKMAPRKTTRARKLVESDLSVGLQNLGSWVHVPETYNTARKQWGTESERLPLCGRKE